MGIAKTWVFPIIRILIFVAIAAALVKLAFFADTGSSADPSFPTGELTEPTTVISLGSIVNEVELDGTINADEAVAAKSAVNGEVVKLLVRVGTTVKKGTPIANVKGYAAGSTTLKTFPVRAPVAGTVSQLSLLVGQQVAIGDTVGLVAPSTFNVTATLQPVQQYRLLTKPTEARVAITGGPAPFTCARLTISAPLPGGEGGGAGATVTCAVPADVVVFAGLTARVSIPAGNADNVLVAPITAVEGNAQTGNVYVVTPGGDPTPTPVTLGLSDGQFVEITGGVEEGTEILQFVPGADPGTGGDGGECVKTGDGGIICPDVPLGG